MMNYIVPDFETDEDFAIQELPKKSTMGGNEDIMELLWQNGQVVMQSQNQRPGTSKKRETRSSVVEEEPGPSGMFMHEDEMASWLHFPINNNSLQNYLYSNDLVYSTPPSSAPMTAAATAATSLPPPPPPSVIIPSRPSVPPQRRVEVETKVTEPKRTSTNFLHSARPNKGRNTEPGPANSGKVAPEVLSATIVASKETPVSITPESKASRVSDKPAPICVGNIIGGGGRTSGIGAVGTSSGRERETCEVSVTSSPGTGGSGASDSLEPSPQKPPPPATDDRKRKGVDSDDNDCHGEDAEYEYADAKKQSPGGSTSTKRSRAAEVHNLSERRRRDRINEKMKALQELIPRCNKSDKASMLDEAIEYMKSLQMHIQMMSMGCNMVPMIYPGVQQYMPPMAQGMGIGMNRPMVPYPGILLDSSIPNPAHLGQQFPVPGFNMPPVTPVGPIASQPANMPDPMMNPSTHNCQNQSRVPNFADPYQQYIGLYNTQLPLPQNQGGMPPTATKPDSGKDAISPDHHLTGKSRPNSHHYLQPIWSNSI